MRVVVTGADGFLGWHTQVRLRALTSHEVVAVSRSEWDRLPHMMEGAEAVVHMAGVNRGSDEAVERENVRLARELVAAVQSTMTGSDTAGPNIVYSNTIHADSDTPYGRGKAQAAAVLADGCTRWGGWFTDLRLPNLFGEGGRPHYNSFVATFAEAVLRGAAPESVEDRRIELLHAQDAAAAILSALDDPKASRQLRGTATTVSGVLDTLSVQYAAYREAQLPDLGDEMAVDLFNTLRFRLFPEHYPVPLERHADPRGSLVETVRSIGGSGQVFVSTTRPGVTRGEHYHLRKIERFAVVGGQARISLRRVCGGPQVVSFDVSGDAPAVVDMPTMWVHNITNTGDSELITMFWTNELFDPDAPDTYWEPVASASSGGGPSA